MQKIYKNIKKITEHQIVIENVTDAKYEEMVELLFADGQKKSGQIKEIDGKNVIITVFQSLKNIPLENIKVKFLKKPATLKLSEDMIGRIFDGKGDTTDSLPPIISEKKEKIKKDPLSPLLRRISSEIIKTGIDNDDFIKEGTVHTIFAKNKESLLETMLQMSEKTEFKNAESPLIIMGGIGLLSSEKQIIQECLEKKNILDHTIRFFHTLSDEIGTELDIPQQVITTAEYFAFEKEKKTMVFLFDMSHYEKTWNIFTTKQLKNELALLAERTGCIQEHKGSITVFFCTTISDDLQKEENNDLFKNFIKIFPGEKRLVDKNETQNLQFTF